MEKNINRIFAVNKKMQKLQPLLTLFSKNDKVFQMSLNYARFNLYSQNSNLKLPSAILSSDRHTPHAIIHNI
jgi:hypothetical protein